MTLLISWIGVDDKKHGKSISSLYIASDSRYTWIDKNKYDYGLKVFGSNRYPDIFGYCGDVLFPSIVIGQLIPQINAGLIFSETDTSLGKNKKFVEYIKTSLLNYPKAQLNGNFTILHGTRVGKQFQCFKTSYSSKSKLKNNEIELPLISTCIFSGGSGKEEFNDNFKSWKHERHNEYKTSRAVFHCLNDTIKNMKDSQTGGKPQIVGLYRNQNTRIFGIVDNKKKYIFGKESSEDINSKCIEWRNENFERMDPETLKIIEGAQHQPR